MIQIIGANLSQWDIGRKVATDAEVNELHFSHRGDVEAAIMDVVVENGMYTAEIPNDLLQSDKAVYVFAVKSNAEGRQTKEMVSFPVRRREKPADYIYTQTEAKSYAVLEDQIRDLYGKAVCSVNGISPDESGNIEIPQDSSPFLGELYNFSAMSQEQALAGWSVINEDSDNWIYIKGEGLKIKSQRNGLYGGNSDCKNVFMLPATGNFLAEVKVTMDKSPSENWQQFALLAMTDQENYVKMIYGFNGELGWSILAEQDGAEVCSHGAGIGWEPATVWMRLKKLGNTYTGYCSTDGVGFRQIGEPITVEDLDTTHIGFTAFNDGGTDSPIEFTVHHVQVETSGPAEGTVLYTEQELTDEQQEQARTNIGAMQKGVSDTELSMTNHDIYDVRRLEIAGVDDYVYMACGTRIKGSDGNYHAVLEYDDTDGVGVILRWIADGVEDVDAATVGQLKAAVGDISTALDHIIALQEELIGGSGDDSGGSDEAKTITFIISEPDGSSEQTALENMTWATWCDSEYNINNYSIVYGRVVDKMERTVCFDEYAENFVDPSSLIEESATYYSVYVEG